MDDAMFGSVGGEPRAQRMIGSPAQLFDVLGNIAAIETADHHLDWPDIARRHGQRANT